MSLRVAFCVIAALNKDYHLPLETCRQLIFGEDVSFSPHFPWLILYASVLMNLEGHWFFNVEELYRLSPLFCWHFLPLLADWRTLQFELQTNRDLAVQIAPPAGERQQQVQQRWPFSFHCLILTHHHFPVCFFPVRRGLVWHDEPLWAQRSPASCRYARARESAQITCCLSDLWASSVLLLGRNAVRQEAGGAAAWALCVWSRAHALPQLCVMCLQAAHALW